MLTQTAERQELHQVIDTLTGDSVKAVLDFARSVRARTETAEWVDPIETGVWNADTLEAIRELEEGRGIQFENAEELFNDLGI